MRISRGQLIAGAISFAPLAMLIVNYFLDKLTANPVQAATLLTGRTAIVLLILSLTCTPLRNLLGLTSFFKIRKTLGVVAFLYAFLHFLIYTGLAFEFNLLWIVERVRTVPFILIGLIALLLLIPLAVTSFNKIQKKMGKNWQSLHRLVYPIAILAIIHYRMAIKGDPTRPVVYAVVLLLLLLLRIPPFKNIQIALKNKWLISINDFLLH